MKKRILSFVLALLMMVSTVPAPVFAADGGEAAPVAETEAAPTTETTAPTEPAETTTPTEPVETTVPTEPAETTAPTEPAETTAPTEPAETTAPTEPAETTAPTEPAETTAPTEPAETTVPTEPAETTAPTEPAETTAPTEPAETTAPTEPPVEKPDIPAMFAMFAGRSTAEPQAEGDSECECPADHDPAEGHVATCPLYTCPRCGDHNCYGTCPDICPDCGTSHEHETCPYEAHVGKYVKLIAEVAADGVYVSADPASGENMDFFYEEFGEDTIMRITDWHWNSGSTGLWYQVELYSGSFPESTEDWTWPDPAWILQDYTDDSYDFSAVLTFVDCCLHCGKPGCTTEHVQCDKCGEYDCTRLHFWCDHCNQYDCGKSHLICRACDEVDCTENHVFCGYCNDYDCGKTHGAEPETAPVIPDAPAFTPNEKVSLADAKGNPVSRVTLPAGTKTSLSAWTDLQGTVTYRWQVCYDREKDLWVNIQGQTGKGILISPAMLLSVAQDNEARIRCVVTDGQQTRTGDAIPVALTAAGGNSSGNSASLQPLAEGDGTENLQKVNVILEYRFTDNSIAKNPWTAELSVGSPISDDVKVPQIMGYVPTFTETANARLYQSGQDYYMDLDYADGLTEDAVLTVVYQPTNVNVTVQHYWQNVNNDNYTLHETVTVQRLTGSVVSGVEEPYDGFYSLLYDETVVAADGSTIVEVYYDRYYYLMKFDLGGGYGVDPIYARYGATVQVDTPTCPGYTFGGWLLNGTFASIPATMPAENRTYTANWTDPQRVNYTVVYWCENADDTNYSLWGSVTKKAVAGTTVSGGNNVSADVSEIEDEQYFTYNDALTDKNVVVKGDGSSVVNVYYLRNYYTAVFNGDNYIAGACVVPEHTHNGSSCDRPLICHIHSESCGEPSITCGQDEHKHSSDCCPIEEHSHSTACYTCVEHTVHEKRCYGNVVGDMYYYSTNGWGNGDGLIHSERYNKYICINNIWYRYTGTANNGQVVDPSCGGLHTHGDGKCTYKDTEHTHGQDNCNCSAIEHSHTSDCYTYPCEDTLHEHADACYRACTKYAHTHTDACYDSSNKNNIIYIITAKYEQNIADIWPTVDMFPTLVGWTIGNSNTVQTSKVVTMTSNLCDTRDGETICEAVVNASYLDHLYYMFESFDPDSPASGNDRKYYNGKYYDKDAAYSQDVNSGGGDWNSKVITGLKAAGREQVVLSSSYQKTERNIFLYYTRNRHNIYFENTHTGSENPRIATVQSVMYGQPLVNYKHNNRLLSEMTAPYPSALEENVYRFDGWYSSPQCYEGTKYDFSTGTMPDGDLYLYANWVPIKHTVKFYLDKDKCEADVTIPQQLGGSYERFNDIQVSHGYVIHAIDAPGVAGGDANHPYRNYDFDGWFYMDAETGEEKAFIIGEGGLPVNQDLKLYAKWSSDILRGYSVYFALDRDGDGVADVGTDGKVIYVADPVIGSTRAGNSKTFDAKGDTDLYAGYRDGFYPNTISHTIVVSADDADYEGVNTFTFLYTPADPVEYTVKYLISGTTTPVPGTAEKRVADNTKAVVTENFVPVSGYMPDAYQKTLVVRPGGENEIIFWYTKDEEHALYQINHYIQNLDGTTWTLYDNETITGDIDTTYNAESITISGFTFNKDVTDGYNVTQMINGATQENLPGNVSAYFGGKISGTLTGNGMQLNLYYTRESYPYQIYFLEYGTNIQLKTTIEGSAYYGALISHTASSVITATDEGVEFELYDTEPETKSMTIRVDQKTGGTVSYNKLTFYYKRCTQDLTVSKEVSGTDVDADQLFDFEVTIDPKYSFHQESYEYAEGKYLRPEDGVLRFSLKHGESITLKGLPTAEYTIAEVETQDFIADFDSKTAGNQESLEFTLTKTAPVNVTCVNTSRLGKLTITKTGAEAIDENQTFIFDVTAQNGFKITVTINGNGSVTIMDLVPGTYTVTERTDWSWRYTPDGNGKSIDLVAGADNEVKFKNTRGIPYWLSGDNFIENQFNLNN